MTVLPASKPGFLILGAAKSGTTSLAANLRTHPNINMPGGELHYFTKHRHRGDDWYLSCFDRPDKLQGEKSPTYFYYLDCHRDIHRLTPDAKLIVMLRDPVRRAFSNWNMRFNDKRLIRQGLEYNKIQPEEHRIRSLDFDGIVNHYLTHKDKPGLVFERPLDIVHRGLYITQIKHLLKFFKRENLYVIITERYFNDEAKGFKEVCRFLGVPPALPETFEKHRVGHYSAAIPAEPARKLSRFYLPFNEELFQFLGYRVPEWDLNIKEGSDEV
jgi:hypothetical protein